MKALLTKKPMDEEMKDIQKEVVLEESDRARDYIKGIYRYRLFLQKKASDYQNQIIIMDEILGEIKAGNLGKAFQINVPKEFLKEDTNKAIKMGGMKLG